MVCENCSSLHDGSYGAGRFCCVKCARGFSTKNKRTEINETVSKKLKGRGVQTIEKNCAYCDERFVIQYRQNKTRQKYCSNSCSMKTKLLDPAYRQAISDRMQKRVADGLHKGWTVRNKRSYAEKFFEQVFDNRGIKYEVEYKISKRDLGFMAASCYFMDFYFPALKLDLEIDGSQHRKPDRMASDMIRDEALNKFGITVYRIPWKNINTASGKKYIQEEIDKILNIVLYLGSNPGPAT